MREDQDYFEALVAAVTARQACYPNNSEVWGVLNRVLEDAAQIKDSQK